MICTDVASRGLDFQRMDWVLQMDCPPTVEDYIHRVGRTARMNSRGEAMLMLTSKQEEPFVQMLKTKHVPINKVEVEREKVMDIRNKLSTLMVQFPTLKLFAQSSFVAYARAIYFMKQKYVFDVTSINFEELAKSYGLPLTPRIRFLRKQGIEVSNKSNQQKRKSTVTEEVVLGKETETANNFSSSAGEKEDNDGEEDFLKLTRKDVFNELTEMDVQEEIMARISSKKAITKTDVAKKMIRRLGNVGVAKRKHFAEESDSGEEDDGGDKGT